MPLDNRYNILQKALNDEPVALFDLTKLADDRVHIANILYQLELSKTDSLERKQLFDLLYTVFGEDQFGRKG